jgi:pimeloyl-ACP methyl ester carboxylesterase
MKELFLISGLGADRRVFEFLDLSGYNLNYINWITPQPNESIEHYAQQLLQQIPVKKPILIGVSFGGMMAVEIGKLIETEKIILISSAKTRSELPWYFKLGGKLKLNKLFPASPPSFLLFYAFGAKGKYEEELLMNIVRETDPTFLNWALAKIFCWRNNAILPDVIKIHGTNDKLFPHPNTDHLIKNGGHFMIVNKASEVSECIKRSLTKR